VPKVPFLLDAFTYVTFKTPKGHVCGQENEVGDGLGNEAITAPAYILVLN